MIDDDDGDEQWGFLQISENHCSCIFYVLCEYYSVKGVKTFPLKC